MQNPLSTLHHFVVGLVQHRHWLSPKRSLSPEELRQMLRQALADPETALLLRQALTGPVLPFVAGMSTCTANQIPKFNTSSCSPLDLTDSVITDSSGNIGIGTSSPPQSKMRPAAEPSPGPATSRVA